jgi:hypothetical protein
MATYEELRDRALQQVGCLGQSEPEEVAQIALTEAMKYVAFHVRVPSLIASATAVAPPNPTLEANAIPLGPLGFNITSSYQTPDVLFIKADAAMEGYGTPYDYREYHHYLTLRSPQTSRLGTQDFIDELPRFPWTITPTNGVWSHVILEGNVLTLFYRVVPIEYGDGTLPPEILPMFDYILVNGACVALKEFLREPKEITTLWTMFDGALKADCDRYDDYINSQRKRTQIKIHRTYRPR